MHTAGSSGPTTHAAGAVGILGPGWATSFSARLLPPAHGQLYRGGPVILYHEDGRVLTLAQAGGGFTRPQDIGADLTVGADGSFALAYHCGLTWTFDSAGRLTGRALEGQRVSFDYDGDGLLLRAAAGWAAAGWAAAGWAAAGPLPWCDGPPPWWQ